MTFGAVLAQYQLLQQRLVVHCGDRTPPFISVQPPKGDCDELSFMRLVAWGYVMIQETARVHLKFLKQLPPLDDFGQLLPELGYLRTWMVHNISYEDRRDQSQLRKAQEWTRRQCQASIPYDASQWRLCFVALCGALENLLRGAVTACEALDSEVDGPRLVAELKKRLDRNWPGHEFDRVVEEVASRLGVRGINVVEFRNRHINKWRELLEIAEDHAADDLLSRRVESDLLDALANSLPLSSMEILRQAAYASPEQLSVLLLILRTRWVNGLSVHQSLQDLVRPVVDADMLKSDV